MKSRCVLPQKQLESVGNYIAVQCENNARMNFLAIVIALHETMGFGSKRLTQFIYGLDKVIKRHKEYERDGVYKMKVDEELKALNIKAELLTIASIPFKEQMRQQRKEEEKQRVSVADAYKLRNSFEKMKKSLRKSERIKNNDRKRI